MDRSAPGREPAQDVARAFPERSVRGSAESRTLHIGAAALLGLAAGCSSAPGGGPVAEAPTPGAGIVFRVASGRSEDPFRAGREAAEALEEAMGKVEPHAVILAECFEEEDRKRRALEGVCSVFPREIIFGGATYGSFGQKGCLDLDAVSLLGIGGDGVSVSAAVVERLGIAGLTMEDDAQTIARRLREAGARLARGLPGTEQSRLLIVIADAHSPKNRYLVEGVQEVVGGDFPITGGSVNKNAGQTFVYFRGRMLSDATIALLLSGPFRVSLAGRQAKENARVIATAREGAAEALENLKARPFAALVFDCAGRMGKLENIEDELAAIQQALGHDVPLFGCYCAGEIGPADRTEGRPGVLSSGVGWHVMVTLLGRE